MRGDTGKWDDDGRGLNGEAPVGCLWVVTEMDLNTLFEGSLGSSLRLRGTRIGIDIIVDAYHRGLSPEQVVHLYHPALTLEQVHGAFTDYLHNRETVDEYCQRLEQFVAEARREQDTNPPEAVRRFRELKRRRTAA